MPAMKTLKVTARPSKREAGSVFWSTSFMLFGERGSQGEHYAEISGENLDDFTVNLINWAHTLPTPDLDAEAVGYSVTVHKPSRWPAGFKAAFERKPLIVRVMSKEEVSV